MNIQDVDAITIEDVKQTETSACSTNFSIKDIDFELWIITGGTPCLAFRTYYFSQRYPNLEMWSNEHWKSNLGRYDHQDVKKIQGPTIDVLPNGLEDVKDFLRKYLPLEEIRIRRIKGLPFKYYIKSKTVLDRHEHTRVYCKLDLDSFSPVTFSSNIYAGRCDEKKDLFSDWWQKTTAIFNPLFDANKRWENLTEDEYQGILNHLALFNPKKDGAEEMKFNINKD